MLCVDKIYNDHFYPKQSVCPRACRPARRMLAISAILVIRTPTCRASWPIAGGYELMPGTRLQAGQSVPAAATAPEWFFLWITGSFDSSLVDLAAKKAAPDTKGTAFLRWADRILSR